MKNEIVLFDNQDIKLEVNMKDETVWLSADQMAKLFDRDYKTIRKHINNALKEELDNSTVAKFATVQKEGSRDVARNIDYYNLDMIISVGWANKVLKDYLLKGYVVNQRRLEYLEKTVKLIDIAGRIDKDIETDEAKEIIKVINKYSNALNLLDDYDHRRVVKPKGTKNNDTVTYKNCINLIELLKFTNESNLFGLERKEGLKSIINNIYQSFGGVDVYPTVEEKAANFLYLITKNHTFIDGNKRIAATLFIYFLEFNNILYKNDKRVIDNNTLVAVTLLIAESNPKEKDILVDLVMNFLNCEE